MWDKSKAINHLNKHAQAHSLGRCAEYVRKAIQSGGVTLNHHISAKDYGSSLSLAGFQMVVRSHATAHYHHRVGDVAIIQPILNHPHGHMAMFDGIHWISDFVQYHGVYPGHSYRAATPPYAIYRYRK
jgi:hypothetical protein